MRRVQKRSKNPVGLQREKTQEIYLDNGLELSDIFPENILGGRLLVMVNLIASGESYHWTYNVHILEPAVHSTKRARCLNNETAVIVKSPPRCRVNGMIKPNYIRWAVPQLASGNQCRFP